jgi:hypothetical protein
MDDPQELRRRAEHYRRTAALVTDAQLSQALIELARSYETRAERIATGEGEDQSAEPPGQ